MIDDATPPAPAPTARRRLTDGQWWTIGVLATMIVLLLSSLRGLS